MYIFSAITLFVFFLRFVAFHFQESPKFLVYRGEGSKVAKVLHYVARKNSRACGLILERLEVLEVMFESVFGRSEGLTLGGGAMHARTTWTQKVFLE